MSIVEKNFHLIVYDPPIFCLLSLHFKQKCHYRSNNYINIANALEQTSEKLIVNSSTINFVSALGTNAV